MPMAMADIARLVRAAQGGDVRSFEALVERHIPQIRRFARAFAASDEDADDLAQEALIKVYKAIGDYRHESEFSTWVFAITRNSFLDFLKSRAGRPQAGQGALGDAIDRAGTAGADELLQREQERRRLWRAIAALPVEFRTTLVLLDIEGLSQGEVAAIERVPLGTVKSRHSRGRGHLRRLLAPEERASPGHAGGNHGGVAVVSPAYGRKMS
jgi:RNA polymerase sigma-70 factor (ECF subfamily)